MKKHSKITAATGQEKETQQVFQTIAERRPKLKLEMETQHKNYYEAKMNDCEQIDEIVNKYKIMKAYRENEKDAEGVNVIKA